MSKLPVISGMECVRTLTRIGFVIDRQRGSHIILVREDSENNGFYTRLSKIR